MSIDKLQERIRKTKNPAVLELRMTESDIPPAILSASDSVAAAMGFFSRELLAKFKGIFPAVRFGFGQFALLGPEGLTQLQELLTIARENQYYVILDAPEILSPCAAENTVRLLLGEKSAFPCDSVVISGYLGSDILKPFLPYCKKDRKDVFVVARTGNKSAPELQDLLSGSRLVHTAAADHVNRYTAGTIGKCGYAGVGLLAAASAAESLRSLRGKYPQLFLLVDGYDYPNANAKNCSFAFDKFGHGAVVCTGGSICAAWRQAESDCADYLECAVAAADRMKKNLTRYISVL